jgi:pyrimidine oxygenase
MKFGVFLPNGSNGYLITKAIPPYLPTWALNRDVTLEAERQGLDFVLSMMKFRGFGGETGFWDACMESFTLMASLASVTERIGLVPTTTILALHPAYVARMMATLDDVSRGRVALNIVTGWNKPEYKQMGLWRGDEYYEQRYEYALEYVNVLRALWSDGRATHKSRFFDLEDCTCLPTPEHEIPIISAGMSTAGRQFVAAVGGHNFVMAAPERVHALAADLRELGERGGRDVATYALLHLVAEETDEKADQVCRDIVAGGDVEAIRTMIASAQMDTVQDGTTEQLRQSAAEELLGGDPEEANMAFMGSWPDWVSGIRRFGECVVPLLECRKGWVPERDGGLRGLGRQGK